MKKIHMILIGAVVVVAIAVGVTMQNDPTLGERLGDAAEEMGDGVEEATEELDPNRTVGEEIGDTIEDAGDEIQDLAD
jgi:Phr family secreted Rap phosphatase inhibitor